MSQNFNVDPYYDDFDPTKNFHRVLFKPGYAVQARELTQSQTILQNQISNFADSIFSQNTPVSGGKVTVNTGCYFVKLTNTYNNVNTIAADFKNKVITDGTGLVLAKVIATAEATGGDYPTLIVNYLSGGQFTDATTIVDVDNSSLAALTIGTTNGTTCTGTASTASISSGVYYIVNGYSQSSIQNDDGSYTKYSIGNFVQVDPKTIILNKYDNTPSYRIGLSITETVSDYVNDSSLLDPAVGASNYQAPGADRYQITLTLTTFPLDIGNDQNFIELVRIVDGTIQKQVDNTVYSAIDDYFAKRTNETNGDFIVSDFKITPAANTINSDKYMLNVGPGIAYVSGYRVENQSTLKIDTNRARTTQTVQNNVNLLDFGNYLYVTGLEGRNQSFFDTTTCTSVDLHLKDVANVTTTNTTTYSATQVGTAYLRGLTYVPSAGETDPSTYVYQAHVFDVATNVLSGSVDTGSTSNTIKFVSTGGKFTSANDAYNGVTLTIDSGPGVGYTGTITAYNGTTKTATVSPVFTTTPTTSSTFSLKFGVKDVETMLVATSGTPYTLSANASISVLGKTNAVSSGDTKLFETDYNKLIYPLGASFVSSVTDTSYTTTQEFRLQSFGSYSTGCQREIQLSEFGESGSFEFLRSGSSESDSAIKQNFLVVVTDNLGGSTTVGQIIDFTAANRSIVVDSLKKKVTLTALDLDPFKATVICKLVATNANDTNLVLKTKTLIEANTQVASYTGTSGVVNNTYIDLVNGQIYIPEYHVASYGTKQNLYVSDVKRIVKIIDTNAMNPTTGMLTSGTDVTHYYNFDDGQTDNYYGHASITLKPGYQAPISIWILFDYYQHSGGDGYFSAESYTNINVADRPTYTSEDNTVYQLKDCIDFRPAVKNVQSDFTFRYKVTPSSTNSSGLFLPTTLSSFQSDYSYYLSRKDVLYIGKDQKIDIIEGVPGVKPFLPSAPAGSLILANITLDPYTAYIPGDGSGQQSSISVTPVLHKRWAFRDITDLQTRVNNLEYYASLNLVEQNASSLQIPDANGLNRFKNGILVDDFSTFGVGDTYNDDFSAAINTRLQTMTPALLVKNYALQNEDLLNNVNLNTTTLNGLGYTPSRDGKSGFYMLDYTEEQLIAQPLASRTTYLNPFAVGNPIGTVTLTPPIDNWIDNTTQPDLLFVDRNLQSYVASDTNNLLEGDPTLQIADWKSIPGTRESIDDGINTTVSEYRDNTYTYGYWSQTYHQTASYLTNISILPYIRSQFIQFNATGMLFNTKVNAFFDEKRVTRLVRKPNIIELTGVSGTFSKGDTIGYVSSNVFHKTGTVLDVYQYATSGKVRLYVIDDVATTTYTTNTYISNAKFNTSGTYQGYTARGTYNSSTHYSGVTSSTQSNVTTVTLSPKASSTDIYTGLEFWIVSGSETGLTSIPNGKKVTVSSYNTGTKVVTLDTAISFVSGDTYSIGPLQTNEVGNVSGVFFLPGGYFHTGQRTFRLDNRVIQQTDTEFLYNKGTENTYAEGIFYAQGLGSQSQQINFSSSISTAKNTTTKTDVRSYTISVTPDRHGGGGGCCVIATELNNGGDWGDNQKAGLIEWCEAKLHDKWWGETFRRGYQVIGSKIIVPRMKDSPAFRKYMKWQFTNTQNMLRGKKFNPLSIPVAMPWLTAMVVVGAIVSKEFATKCWTSLYKKK